MRKAIAAGIAGLLILAIAAWLGQRQDPVKAIDASLESVQREQAILADAMQAAAAALLESRMIPQRREVVKMSMNLDRLRKATGEIRAVALKELQAPPSDPARMAQMDLAMATAARLVDEVRNDIAEQQLAQKDQTVRELSQRLDGSLANLGKVVASIRALLAARKQTAIPRS